MSQGARTAVRLAADIGGTFTDVVLETPSGTYVGKVLTTIDQPEQAIIAGARLCLEQAGLTFADVALFVHGTTLATNAVISRQGARTALIATAGFRDVLDIATEGRYDQYDLRLQKPTALIPRPLRHTVAERMDVHGRVLLPLDAAALRALLPTLRAQGVDSIAVAFLHAYANPAHEQQAADIIRASWPEVALTLSHEVSAEANEYERTSTAAINAYVQPLMDGYLARLEQRLADESFQGAIYLMSSDGGLSSLSQARRLPVRLIESGPAGGAIFAASQARTLGERRAMAFDMGGTTAKICLVDDFQPSLARAFEVDRAARFLKGSGLPIRIPVMELVEIGAGGGSLASVDPLGRIRVGPGSAGAAPGPACYGRGGRNATVTDASLALGLMDPARFAGGSIALSDSAARAALEQDLAVPLGTSTELAAYAIHEMVCENMAAAARVHAIERGRTIGQYTIIAFGGAAPLHAARVAEKLGAKRVVIPGGAGVGSALGFLAAPVSYEQVRSHHVLLDEWHAPDVAGLLATLARQVRDIVEPGSLGQPIRLAYTAFMRYEGQGHELAVAFTHQEGHSPADELATTLRASFESEYAARFTRLLPDSRIEITNWSARGHTVHDSVTPALASRIEADASAGRGRFFDVRAGQWQEIAIWPRQALASRQIIVGPAVITETETTTYVPQGFHAHADALGNLILEHAQP